MNFVTEFLSFMAWLRCRRHKVLEYLGLWVYLFTCNNAAAVQDEDGSWCWPVWFEVDSRDLCGFMDGMSSKRLWDLRQELIRNSRVEYQKASGGQPARYALVPFDTELAQVHLASTASSGACTVWKPRGETPGNPARFILEPPREPNRFSSDFDINNKYINIKALPGDEAANPNGFNIPPQLTEEEKQQLEAEYPDPVQRFWAGMALRDKKAEEEKAWAY
ncbi:hypothetical protein [Eubacterium sp. 1001713B170207_170306_E7]|uniref:hypothetical protein n=1 Tax=Eubacterium sp. 1001713B170207_170306_E7 TaxID=2787097 RepID=UPI00189BB893|nr:hypothetical protein [Eubacterium sp. 1001713B170207_170306_E7]